MYDVVYDLFFQCTAIGLIMLIIVSFLSNIRNAENSCTFYFFASWTTTGILCIWKHCFPYIKMYDKLTMQIKF